jgi:hypothetical protein
MRETIEFRIPEESAQTVLGAEDGTTLGGSVRKIELAPTDERMARIGEADALAKTQGRALFTSWRVRRDYSRQELDEAQALVLEITKVFEPAGEECGTEYDDRDACRFCGVGGRQANDLHLDLARLPKKGDIAASIAGEWVVSQRFAEALLDSGLTGFELRPVQHVHALGSDPLDLSAIPSGRRVLEAAENARVSPESGDFWVWVNRPEQRPLIDAARAETAQVARTKTSTRLPVWHQLVVTAPPARIAGQTRFGVDPFDDDLEGRFRCPLGHVVGLNRLSEVYLRADTWPRTDFAVTHERVGEREGLLRPSPILLASQQVRALLDDRGIKGYRLEVAHLVDA